MSDTGLTKIPMLKLSVNSMEEEVSCTGLVWRSYTPLVQCWYLNKPRCLFRNAADRHVAKNFESLRQETIQVSVG